MQFFGRHYASPEVHLFIISFCCSLGSHFQLYLDSVVDNLQPSAHKYLTGIYGNEEDAERIWARFIAARTLGMAFGSLFSILIPNSTGRKKPVLQGIFISILGICATYCIELQDQWGIEIAILGRLSNGIGTSITLVFGSTLVSEIAPVHKRGKFLALLACLACIGEALGMVIPALMSENSNWCLPMYLPLVALIPSFLLILQAPDSPRSLFDYKSDENAKESLRFYRNMEETDISLNDMIEERLTKDKKQRNRKNPVFLDGFFNDMRFVRALCCGAFVLPLVHLNDWVWISFSTQIFTEVGGLPEKEAQFSSIIMCLPMVVISVVLVFYFDKFKRKTLLIGSTAASSVICFVLLLILLVCEGSGSLFFKYLVPTVATIDVALGSIASEGAFTIVPELFDPSDASRGTAIATVAQNVFGSVLTVLVPWLLRKGIFFCLTLSILTTTTYCFVVGYFVPETQGKSNSEIANSFSRNKFDVLSTVRGSAKRLYVYLKNISLSFNNVIMFTLIFIYQALMCYSFFTLARFASLTITKRKIKI